ncbi:hypothetical protein EW026_g2165 [Hermanssonia centrifuga]|uniref:Uncharacterized protein n=1 Tax=Hermanssonia centrifuga TaxID=98765 RepID=A0A4S4KP38_9APHY|nr:hypothetical protein EW026_g2165 [Hermanssonia centrifuga]
MQFSLATFIALCAAFSYVAAAPMIAGRDTEAEAEVREQRM